MKYSIWKIMRVDCEEGANLFYEHDCVSVYMAAFRVYNRVCGYYGVRLECNQCGVCHIQASLCKMQSVFGS